MSRDPVDIAEQQRDYDETHGDEYTRHRDQENYEQNRADMEYGDEQES